MYSGRNALDNSLWMEIDVKVRKLISDLLEPSLAKLHTAEIMQSKIYSSHRLIKEKVSVIESRLSAVISAIPNLEPINKRVAEHSIKITGVELENKSHCEALANEIESLASTLGNMASNGASANNQIDMIRKDMRNYISSFIQLREFVEQEVNVLKNQVKEPFVNQAETNIVQQLQIKQFEKNLQGIKEEISELDLKNKNSERSISREISNFESQLQEYYKFRETTLDEINRIQLDYSKRQTEIGEKLKCMQDDFKHQLEESEDHIKKSQNVNIEAILDFVLFEPRYKKKLLDYKKGKTLGDITGENTLADDYDQMRIKQKDNQDTIDDNPQLKNIKEESILDKHRAGSIKRNNIEKKRNKEKSSKESNKRKISKRNESAQGAGMHSVIKSSNSGENFDNEKAIVSQTKDSITYCSEHHPIKENKITIERQGISNTDTTIFFTENPMIYTKESGIFREKSCESDSFSEANEPMKNNDIMILLEDIQNQIEGLRQEISAFSTKVSMIENTLDQEFRLQSQQITLVNEKLEKFSTFINSYIEKELKSWVKQSISSKGEEIIKRFTESEQQKNLEINNVLHNSHELEDLLKQASFDFNSYVTNKRRETADYKLEFKRIYSKFDGVSKKNIQLLSQIEGANHVIKALKDLLLINYLIKKQDEKDKEYLYFYLTKDNESKKKSLQPGKVFSGTEKVCSACQYLGPQVLLSLKMACSGFSSSSILYKNKELTRNELLEREGELLENVCGSAEFKPVENELITNSRSLTPELPSISKQR